MAELKRTFFFGYSSASVHEVLRAQKREYEARISQLEEWNTDFKRTIERYQEKELFISEALTEAKRLSRDILVDSQLKAEELVRLTEEDLSERVRNTEMQLKELEDTKRAIVDHEEYMKVELRQLLSRQMEMIDSIDVGELREVEHKLEALIDEGESLIEDTKRTVSRQPEALSTAQADESVPVFSFDGF